MDKKKVLILILSIAIIISILVLSVFLLTKGDKPKDKDTDKEPEKEEVVDLDKQKEILFEERQKETLSTNDNEEYLKEQKELEELEKNKEVVVTEPNESTGGAEVKDIGDSGITFTPGGKSADLNEIKEQRKKNPENAFTVDAGQLDKEFEYGEFKKDVTTKNKKLVTELDKSFDFKTAEIGTFVYNKAEPNKTLLVYVGDKSLYGNKNERDYYDSFIYFNKEFYLKNEENAKKVIKRVNDAGFIITKEELDKAVPEVIKNDGFGYYELRNLKLVIFMGDDIRINKID